MYDGIGTFKGTVVFVGPVLVAQQARLGSGFMGSGVWAFKGLAFSV